MSKFFVEATYSFPVVFTVEAESAEAARSLIEKYCSMSISSGVRWNPPKSVANYEDVDWECPLHANLTINGVECDD